MAGKGVFLDSGFRQITEADRFQLVIRRRSDIYIESDLNSLFSDGHNILRENNFAWKYCNFLESVFFIGYRW